MIRSLSRRLRTLRSTNGTVCAWRALRGLSGALRRPAGGISLASGVGGKSGDESLLMHNLVYLILAVLFISTLIVVIDGGVFVAGRDGYCYPFQKCRG